jgi:hypothetical protein
LGILEDLSAKAVALIENKVSEKIKKNLTTSISLPKSEVFFDEVRATHF